MVDVDWTWPMVLAALLAREDLNAESASWAMRQIMSGEASPAQVAGFVTALRAKGETSTELRGIADTMLEHARRIDVPAPSLDIVGTGGDRAHTVNISTMSAIIAASAGVTIVKHGNRAASSSSGTADVLEALGVDLSLDPAGVVRVAADCGITFCFAQVFHPAMRHVAGPRRDLGIPTVFNVLGPLTNPAQPTYAAVGVADPAMAPIVAGVFASRGKDTAVFRGEDGLDELTLAATSRVWWVRDGEISEFCVAPEDVGLDRAPLSALRGADPAHNAQVVRSVLAGDRGPIRDAVVLNTGVALAVTDSEAPSDQESFHALLRRCMSRAENAIDQGLATEKLATWAACTRALG